MPMMESLQEQRIFKNTVLVLMDILKDMAKPLVYQDIISRNMVIC